MVKKLLEAAQFIELHVGVGAGPPPPQHHMVQILPTLPFPTLMLVEKLLQPAQFIVAQKSIADNLANQKKHAVWVGRVGNQSSSFGGTSSKSMKQLWSSKSMKQLWKHKSLQVRAEALVPQNLTNFIYFSLKLRLLNHF